MVQSVSYVEDRKKMTRKGRKFYLSNNNLLKNYNVNDLKSKKKVKIMIKLKKKKKMVLSLLGKLKEINIKKVFIERH